jgi:hypothetical protein
MKKRSIRDVPNIGDVTLVESIMRMKSKKMKAYAAFIYLFGNRVSEGIGLPLTTDTGEYYEYYRTTKKGTKKVRINKKILVPNKWLVEPLKAWAVEYDQEQGLLWVKGIKTFKRGGRPNRDVWVLESGQNEKPLINIVWKHTLAVRKKYGDNAPLFDITRQGAYMAFRKELGVNAFPHKLRDLRATKDATTYGLDAKDLQEKFYWANAEMAMYYGRKNKTDIIAKMRRNIG